jgi:hypothetical protein
VASSNNLKGKDRPDWWRLSPGRHQFQILQVLNTIPHASGQRGFVAGRARSDQEKATPAHESPHDTARARQGPPAVWGGLARFTVYANPGWNFDARAAGSTTPKWRSVGEGGWGEAKRRRRGKKPKRGNYQKGSDGCDLVPRSAILWPWPAAWEDGDDAARVGGRLGHRPMF